MWYFYDTYPDNYTNFNKNLDNNQNYIINKSLKNNLIFDYLFNHKNLKFPLNILWNIIIFVTKEIILDRLKVTNKYFFVWVIHTILLILFLFIVTFFDTLLIFFVLFFIYVYFSLFISRKFINYFDMNVNILWFRKWSRSINRSYEKLLIPSFKFKKQSISNKLIVFSYICISFWITALVSTFLLITYL